MFWDELKEGLAAVIFFALAGFIIPSSAILGVYLMGKLVPALSPACEVRK